MSFEDKARAKVQVRVEEKVRAKVQVRVEEKVRAKVQVRIEVQVRVEEKVRIREGQGQGQDSLQPCTKERKEKGGYLYVGYD